MVAADESACQLDSVHNSWHAPCTADCCDEDIRNYYTTSEAAGGAPVDFYRWRAYDPRHRGWYKEMKAAHLNGVRSAAQNDLPCLTASGLCARSCTQVLL